MWTHSDTGFQSTVPSVGTYPVHLLGWSLQLWRKQNLIMCSVFPLALLELRDISTYSLCLIAATAKWQISESLYIRPVHTGALLDFKEGLLILPWSSHQPCEPGWVRVDQLRTLNKLAQVIELMCVVAITRTNLSPNLWGFKSSFLQVQFKGELSR